MDHQNKREHWSAILEQQRQSNLGIKQFCTEQNISYQTFHYWSKKLSQPEPETQGKIMKTPCGIRLDREHDFYQFLH